MLGATKLAKAIGTNLSRLLENLESKGVSLEMKGDLSVSLTVWILQKLQVYQCNSLNSSVRIKVITQPLWVSMVF